MRLHAISFQSSLFPAHWRPMLRSAVNKQISVSKVGSRLLLAFLCVALATGCLTATFPGPAATPTIAPAARRSIAEIRMIDATKGTFHVVEQGRILTGRAILSLFMEWRHPHRKMGYSPHCALNNRNYPLG